MLIRERPAANGGHTDEKERERRDGQLTDAQPDENQQIETKARVAQNSPVTARRVRIVVDDPRPPVVVDEMPIQTALADRCDLERSVLAIAPDCVPVVLFGYPRQRRRRG